MTGTAAKNEWTDQAQTTVGHSVMILRIFFLFSGTMKGYMHPVLDLVWLAVFLCFFFSLLVVVVYTK